MIITDTMVIGDTNAGGGGSRGKSVTSFSITTPPRKVNYVIGEILDLTDMIVTATYSDGTTENVTSLCTFNPAEGTVLTLSHQTITVRWGTHSAVQAINVVEAHTYGVSWEGTPLSKMTRTDLAAEFVDPVPYVSGASAYGSPFDNISPWKDMVIVDDAEAGKVVAIPKYWFKWTREGDKMKLQIADHYLPGFLVSPAHQDRGDGKGERDVVYVGRYHCASDYKSKSGVKPITNITRSAARSNISNLGADVWQFDFAMFWTVNMLYLVEFADWDSQKCIGYGCGNNLSSENSGKTDSMPYHTGTMSSSRTTYATGIQYRNIEDWWANVYDWVDGIYFSGTNVFCIKNPTSFSDSAGGTNVGTRASSDGYIKSWTDPSSKEGFEYALYPNSVTSSHDYVCDWCGYGSTDTVLHFGGYWNNQNENHGAFYLNDNHSSNSNSNIGCRILEHIM